MKVNKKLKLCPAGLCIIASLIFGSTAYAISLEEKNYGFGEVDPIVKEKRDVELTKRISNGANYALLFMAAAVDSIFGGVMLPFALIGTGSYIGFANSTEHPTTSTLGLNAEDNRALPLNTYGGGHSVVVTEDSAESFEWKKELVKSAKHIIEISGSFCGGRAFREILTIMDEKLSINRELQIRIISSFSLLQTADLEKIKELREKYPKNFHVLIIPIIFVTNPGFSDSENHVKLLVADEEYFIVGGSNLQESMLSKGDGSTIFSENRDLFEKLSGSQWRDMDMVAKGSAAKTLRLEFYKLWAKWAYLSKNEDELINYYVKLDVHDAWIDAFERSAKKVDNVDLKVIPSSPQWAENGIIKEYVKILDQAIEEQADIEIANLIFYPPQEILDKLKEAIKQGCRVTIISTNLQEHSPPSSSFAFAANRHGFINLLESAQKEFVEENLKIYEYNVPDGIYHKKILVMGNDISIFGSTNLGMRSYRYDDELSIVIKSKEVADQVKNILEKDKTYSKKLTAEEIDSFGSRLEGILGTFTSEVI